MYSKRSRTWFRRLGSSARIRMTVGLGQDPLGERALALRQLHRGADIQRQIAGALAEGEQ
jgi:hypothetical protein